MTTTTTTTHLIPKSEISFAIERVEMANKKATRIGRPGYTYSVRNVEPMISEGEIIEMVEFDVIGKMPKLGNYEIVAILKRDPNVGFLIEAAEDGFELAPWINHGATCDHCGKSRARNVLYILRDVDGGTKVVGNSCVELYTGVKPYISWMRASKKLAEECEYLSKSYGVPSYSIRTVVELAVGAVALHKFVSAETARYDKITSTSQHVWNALRSKEGVNRKRLIAASDAERVNKIMEYAQNLTSDGSEYMENLSAIANAPSGLVSADKVGLLASVVASYDRAQINAVEIKNIHLGTPKEKFKNVEVFVIERKLIYTVYGESELIKMVTADGALLTWFTSSTPDLHKGKAATVNFTVKSHDEYQGQAQTMVLRVKVC